MFMEFKKCFTFTFNVARSQWPSSIHRSFTHSTSISYMFWWFPRSILVSTHQRSDINIHISLLSNISIYLWNNILIFRQIQFVLIFFCIVLNLGVRWSCIPNRMVCIFILLIVHFKIIAEFKFYGLVMTNILTIAYAVACANKYLCILLSHMFIWKYT